MGGLATKLGFVRMTTKDEMTQPSWRGCVVGWLGWLLPTLNRRRNPAMKSAEHGTSRHVPQAREFRMARDPHARRPLVAGNWKMNGLRAGLAEAQAIQAAIGAKGAANTIDILLCPPATLVLPLAQASSGSRLMIGGQDCHTAASGAHTGDI